MADRVEQRLGIILQRKINEASEAFADVQRVANQLIEAQADLEVPAPSANGTVSANGTSQSANT